jgi:hypothetical protein
MNPEAYYKAPWSLTVKILSTVTTAVVVICASLPLLLAPSPLWLKLLLPTTAILLLGGCALLAVRGYSLERDALLVRRLFWNTRVDLRQLAGAEARSLTADFHLRLFGNGGLFAFTGWYWCRSLGRYRLFGTDLKRSVVLRLARGTVVITPDRPEEFLANLLAGRSLTPR